MALKKTIELEGHDLVYGITAAEKVGLRSQECATPSRHAPFDPLTNTVLCADIVERNSATITLGLSALGKSMVEIASMGQDDRLMWLMRAYVAGTFGLTLDVADDR